ncbi:hypothetical protein ACFQZ8_32095, partial [Micromonospora azadirachtae]
VASIASVERRAVALASVSVPRILGVARQTTRERRTSLPRDLAEQMVDLARALPDPVRRA